MARIVSDQRLITQSRCNPVHAAAWKVQDDQHPDEQRTPAAPATPATPGPSVTPVMPSDAQQSSNWAGYTADGGTFTAVTGSWTIPSVDPSGTPGAVSLRSLVWAR